MIRIALHPMQAAFRERGAELPVPALVHWNVGHFAALMSESDGRYLARDPTFGTDVSVSRAALDEEASGYFLVAAGPLPSGWRAVDAAEAEGVWGKGAPVAVNGERITCNDETQGGSGCTICPPGLATYRFHSLVASLNIQDTPVGYSPPAGPPVSFTLTYNQRDAFQPQIFSFGNLGSRWTFGWLEELHGLVLSDLNLEEGLIRIRLGKGGRDRVVPLGTKAVRALDDYLKRGRPELLGQDHTDRLFLSYRGQSSGSAHAGCLGQKARPNGSGQKG